MQKKLNSFLKKEIERFETTKYIEGITFEQLKKLSIGKDNYCLN